jgi:hypothetical protein
MRKGSSDLSGSQSALVCLCVCARAQLGLREFNSIAIWLSTRDRKGSGILDLLEERLDRLIRIIQRVEAIIVMRELSRRNHGVEC